MTEEHKPVYLCKEDADFVVQTFLEMKGEPLDSISRLSFHPNIVEAYDQMVSALEVNKQKFFNSMVDIVEECNKLAIFDLETMFDTAQEALKKTGAEVMVPVAFDFFSGSDYTEALVEVMMLSTVQNMRVSKDARAASTIN